MKDPNVNILDEMPIYLISLASFFAFFSSILIVLDTIKKSSKVFSDMDRENIDRIFQDSKMNNFCDYMKGTLFMFIKKFNTNFLGIFLLLSLIVIFGFNYSSGVLFRGFTDVIFGIDAYFNERNFLYILYME